MTDRVAISPDRSAEAKLTSRLIRYAGGSEDGFVVKSSNDILASDSGLSGAPLSAFSESHAGDNLDITINSGEGFVDGNWFGRDTSSTVTLASSTNNQSIYAGIDRSETDAVLIGLSSAFSSEDPKIHIWDASTDSNGVSSVTDKRNLQDFRIRNEDIQALQSYTGDETTISEALADGGNDEMDADEFAGANGSNGQFLQTDGAAVSWASISEVPSGAIMLNDNDGASLPTGFVLCDGNNGTPDLRNTYVKGANGTSDEGTTGGSNTVTLTTSELASHSHSYNDDINEAGQGHSADRNSQSVQTGSAGGDSAHQNEPNFIELRYMMKS